MKTRDAILSGAWKRKVAGRIYKDALFFNRELDANFPLSEPVHLIPSGVDRMGEIDGKIKANSPFHEFNHFAVYDKLYNNINTKQETADGEILRNLALRIAQSSILNRETRLSRFEDVLRTYLYGNCQPDSEMLQSFFHVISHTISDEMEYKAFLSKAKSYFPSVNIRSSLPFVIEGLCLNGEVEFAVDLFLRENVLQSFSLITETLISKGMAIFAFEVAVKVHKKNNGPQLSFWAANNLLKSFLLLTEKSDVEKIPDMVSWILDNIDNSCWPFGLITTLYQLTTAFKYLESTVGSEVKSQISFNSYDVKYIQWRAKMETLLRKKEVGKAYALQAQAVYSDHLVYNQLIVQIASDALELNKNVEEQKRRSQLMAKAQVLYTKLAENNLHINSETFNVLLKLFSSTGNHKRCRSYIWKMHRHSIPVTAQHYYYYIDAYCKSGSVILARDAVGEMLQWKIQPSLKIFYRMIEAFLNQSPPNFDKAFAYLKAAPRMKIFVDERMMKLFIKRLSKLNTVDKLELSQIWCNLLFSTIPPNALVCNYMMLVGLELKRFDIVDEYYLLLCRSTASTDRQSELLYFKSLFLRKDFVGCKNLLRNMPELADCAEALEIISNLSFETHDHHLK